jgi:hypothetical protein
VFSPSLNVLFLLDFLFLLLLPLLLLSLFFLR